MKWPPPAIMTYSQCPDAAKAGGALHRPSVVLEYKRGSVPGAAAVFYSRRSQFPFRCAFAATPLSEHALHYRFRQLRSRRFGARFGSRLDHLSARGCSPGCRWPARHLAGVFEAERPKKIPTKFRKDRNPSNSLF